MFKSNEQGRKRAAQHYLRTAQVDFTRSDWRQLFKLNRSLGAQFLRGFVLRYELAAYLTAHEAAGVDLDEGCQEVRYEDGVYMLLKKMQKRRKSSRRRTIVRQRRFSAVEKAKTLNFKQESVRIPTPYQLYGTY